MAQQTKPEFREPDIGVYSTGDCFSWTHEATRSGVDCVEHTGTVVEVFDNRVQIDVGGRNYYEISNTGKVVSISDNHNRSLVGYTVYK